MVSSARPGAPIVFYRSICCRGDEALAGFLFRDLGALLTGLRQSDDDCLLPALHGATFSAFSRFEGAGFFPMHCALNALTCCFSILCHVCPRELKGGSRLLNASRRLN